LTFVSTKEDPLPKVRFHALAAQVVRDYRAGKEDAYGRRPERRVSDGSGLPCRHCLADIQAGEEYLVLAHRPFATLQPYAETGPIFLHARACRRYPESGEAPASFLERPRMMLRGYDADERIVYGTGTIVETNRLVEATSAILADDVVDFVDVRSASNGCFQCRVRRGVTSAVGD
jgi:hypothetical protein